MIGLNKRDIKKALKAGAKAGGVSYGVKCLTPQKEKLVSNWCQNRKNHNFKRNKILQTIDFKGFAKKISKN